MADVEIRGILPAELEQARQLLLDGGWGSRVQDAETFRRLVERSSRALVARSCAP
jgi:hypothetical protein